MTCFANDAVKEQRNAFERLANSPEALKELESIARRMESDDRWNFPDDASEKQP